MRIQLTIKEFICGKMPTKHITPFAYTISLQFGDAYTESVYFVKARTYSTELVN